MKKAISLGVAAAMAATLLAGCGTAASSAAASSEAASTADSATAESTAASEAAPSEAHEINTIRGNVDTMLAREETIGSKYLDRKSVV